MTQKKKHLKWKQKPTKARCSIIDEWKMKNVLWIHNGELFQARGRTPVIFDNMAKSKGHYVKQKKTDKNQRINIHDFRSLKSFLVGRSLGETRSRRCERMAVSQRVQNPVLKNESWILLLHELWIARWFWILSPQRRDKCQKNWYTHCLDVITVIHCTRVSNIMLTLYVQSLC